MKPRVGWLLAGSIWLALACNLSAVTATLPEADTRLPSGTAAQKNPATETPAGPTATATPFPSYEKELCAGNTTVVIPADPELALAVRPQLDQFETDLCAAGYGVIERSLDFASPPELRSYLADLYRRTEKKLEGAIFIGRVPLAYQTFALAGNPSISEEAISFQYYSDLDGEFSRSDSYRSPHGHEFSYDQHTGPVEWEIWTGVLPVYKDNEALTAEDLRRFFEKDHAYRTGASDIPEGFVEIDEHYTAKTAAEQANFIDVLRNGPYAWTPLSTSPAAQFFFDGPTLSVMEGYAAMSAGAADIVVTENHGGPEQSGRIDIRWVETNPVRTLLFWTGGCSVGNLDYPQNFLTAIVYSRTSAVLVASGTTNDSGGFGTNREGSYGHNIAVRIAGGQNLGQAVRGHMNVPLIHPWDDTYEFHHALLILIGDPTLRFRG
jgi:hypothetical protein